MWRAAQSLSKGLEEIFDQRYEDGWVRLPRPGTAPEEGVLGIPEMVTLLKRDEDAIADMLVYMQIGWFSIGELAYMYARDELALADGLVPSYHGQHIDYILEEAREFGVEEHSALAWAVAVHIAGRAGIDGTLEVIEDAVSLGIGFDSAAPFLTEGVHDMALVRKAIDSGVDAAIVAAGWRLDT